MGRHGPWVIRSPQNKLIVQKSLGGAAACGSCTASLMGSNPLVLIFLLTFTTRIVADWLDDCECWEEAVGLFLS